MELRLWTSRRTRAPRVARRVRDPNGGPKKPGELAALSQRLARVERERDELIRANDQLREVNLALRTSDVAFRDLLNLADERSHGMLRILVEDIGEELAQWLIEEIESSKRG